MTRTITDADRDAIRATLQDVTLVHGVGNLDAHTACTIAAVNLALTGELRDDDPADCISPVIRRWVIGVQDSMPEAMLAEDAWRDLIPWIAGTRSTSDVEQARLALILDWMWDRLAAIRDVVPESARDAWDRMLAERTSAATAAYDAAATRATAAAAYDAAAYDAAATTYAAADAAAFWRDADPAALLAALIHEEAQP